MTTREEVSLTAGDRAIISREAERIPRRAPARDPQFPGCVLAFLGMVLLTLTPALGNWLAVSRALAMGLFLAAVMALFAGAGIALFGASAGTRAARRELESAVDPIVDWSEGDGSREDALRAAVRLLDLAVVGSESEATWTFRPDRMAERLGPRGLGLVQAVEIERRAATPGLPAIFTRRS